MFAYVSTVGRGKILEESSKIYKVDLASKKVLAQVRLPFSMFDLANPRGGVRGSRGIVILQTEAGPQLWVAGFDGLFNLDMETMFINKGYWFKNLRDIHNIYQHGNRILVTSTWNNSIYEFDSESGDVFLISDFSNKFINPLSGDTPDQYHLNSVCGELALLNRQGVVVNVHTGSTVWSSPDFKYGHDLVPLPSGEIATCSSGKKSVVAFRVDKAGYRVLLDLQSVYPACSPAEGKLAIPGWTRGLTYSSETGLLYVGAAPAQILVVDPGSSGLVDTIKISDEVADSVFAIALGNPG